MFCPRCGTQNEAGEVNCLRCGTELPQPRPVGTSETNRETSQPPGNQPVSAVPPSNEPVAPGIPPTDEPLNYPPPPGQNFPPPPPSGYGAQPPYGAGQGGYGGGQGYGGGYGNQGYGSQPPPYGGPGYRIGNTPSYGAPGYGGAPVGDVPNYLIWSILTTLLCCIPAGVVAIVYSSQVNSKLQVGDYAGAVDASNKAKMWCLISVGVSVAIFVIFFLLSLLGNM
ncbi:MAG: CD225/dispanin family protein [Acidobacteriota bacterium]